MRVETATCALKISVDVFFALVIQILSDMSNALRCHIQLDFIVHISFTNRKMARFNHFQRCCFEFEAFRLVANLEVAENWHAVFTFIVVTAMQ